MPLTPIGERTVREASAVHARNIQAFLIDALPEGSVETFAAGVRALSKTASASLPVMP